MTSEEILEQLNKSSTYLVASYKEADASLKRYLADRTPVHLFNAASGLCDGLRKLGNDPGFWTAVAGLSSLPSKEREEAFGVITNDANALFDTEYNILVNEARFTEEAARRLLRQARSSLEEFANLRDAAALNELQGQIRNLTIEVCDLAGEEPEKRERLWGLAKKFGNIPRPLVRGAEALGGAALGSVNGLVAVKTGGANIWIELKTGIGSFGTGWALTSPPRRPGVLTHPRLPGRCSTD